MSTVTGLLRCYNKKIITCSIRKHKSKMQKRPPLSLSLSLSDSLREIPGFSKSNSTDEIKANHSLASLYKRNATRQKDKLFFSADSRIIP